VEEKYHAVGTDLSSQSDPGQCRRRRALFRVGDDIFAIDNYDPIGEANVLARGIVCDIRGELCVASPLYKQHFSLRSGQCLEDENVRVNTYDVRISSGAIEIQQLKRQAA